MTKVFMQNDLNDNSLPEILRDLTPDNNWLPGWLGNEEEAMALIKQSASSELEGNTLQNIDISTPGWEKEKLSDIDEQTQPVLIIVNSVKDPKLQEIKPDEELSTDLPVWLQTVFLESEQENKVKAVLSTTDKMDEQLELLDTKPVFVSILDSPEAAQELSELESSTKKFLDLLREGEIAEAVSHFKVISQPIMQIDRVITAVNDWLRTNPDISDVWQVLGDLQILDGQPDEAVVSYTKALKLLYRG